MTRTLPDVIAPNLDILIVWHCFQTCFFTLERTPFLRVAVVTPPLPPLLSDWDQPGTAVRLQRAPLPQPWEPLLWVHLHCLLAPPPAVAVELRPCFLCREVPLPVGIHRKAAELLARPESAGDLRHWPHQHGGEDHARQQGPVQVGVGAVEQTPPHISELESLLLLFFFASVRRFVREDGSCWRSCRSSDP